MEPDDNVFKVLTDEINVLHCNGLLFVKGECPLESLVTLTLVVALRIIDPTRELQARACGALKETSLVSWTTLPESAAV